jgi:hypothetical protein
MQVPHLTTVALAATLLLGGASLRGQTSVQEASLDAQQARLHVRLAPGKIWRQSVRFESEVTPAEEASSLWTFRYELRLRCVERTPEGFAVAGQFVDWHLRLQKGECRYDWADGRYVYEGDLQVPSDDAQSSCRELLAAWSAGLRDAEIRFLLREDGEVTELRGLEGLHEKVAASLAAAGELPPEMELYFGEEGLKRADGALALALAVPRPLRALRAGDSWEHESAVAGLALEETSVRRTLRLHGFGRERRFRYAEIGIDPACQVLDEAGRWHPMESGARAEQEADAVRILTDSGLVYSMRAGLCFALPGDRLASFRLLSQLVD